MENIHKEQMSLTYLDLNNIDEIASKTCLILVKINKQKRLEKNDKQIKILKDISLIHERTLNTLIEILEEGKTKIYE